MASPACHHTHKGLHKAHKEFHRVRSACLRRGEVVLVVNCCERSSKICSKLPFSGIFRVSKTIWAVFGLYCKLIYICIFQTGK